MKGFLFLIFPLILLISPLLGQQKPESLASLDEKALLSKAEKEYLTLEKNTKTFEDFKNLVLSTREVLSNIEKQITLHKLPSPPKFPAKTIRVKRLEGEKEYLSSLIKSLEEKSKFFKEKITNLEQLKKRLEDAEGQVKALNSSLSEFQLTVGEMESRLAKKTLKPEEAKKALRDFTSKKVLEERDKLLKISQEWEKEIKNIPGSLQKIQEEIKKIEEASQKASENLKETQEKFQALKKEETIAKDFQDKDPTTLLGLVPSVEVEREKLQKMYEYLLKDLDEKSKYRESYNRVEEKIQKTLPPNIDSLDSALKSKTPSAQRAEKELKAAQLTLQYQEERIKALKAYQEANRELLSRLNSSTITTKKYRDHLIRYQVLLRLLYDFKDQGKIKNLDNLPKSADLYDLDEEIEKLEQTLQNFSKEITVLKEKKTARNKAIVEAQKELQKKKSQIPDLEKNFQEQLAWAKWIQEVEKLPTPQLIQRYQEAKKNWESTEKKIANAQKDQMDLAGGLEKQWKEIKSLENPLLTRSLKVLSTLQEEAKNRLKQIIEEKKLQTSLELSDEETKKYGDLLKSIAQGLPVTDSSKGPISIESRLEKQLDFFSSIKGFLEKEEEKRNQWISSANKYLEALQYRENAIKEALGEARKIYGSALELQLRMGRKEMAEKDLPPGVNDSAKRETILNLMEQISSLEKDRETMQGQTEEMKRLQNRCKAKQDILEIRSTLVAQKISALREREKLAANFQIDFSKLGDTEKKRFEQEVHQRIENENSWTEFFLNFFHSPLAEEQLKLLEAYYQDLEKIRLRSKNLKKRIAITQRLIRATQEEKKLINKFIPLLVSESSEETREDVILIAQMEGALKTTAHQEAILARVKQRTGQTITLPEPMKQEDKAKYLTEGTNYLFQAWVQDLSFQAWTRALEQDLSKLGLEAEIGSYNDDIGEIESKEKQLEPERKKLIGHSPAALAALDPSDKPQTREETSRYLRGDIGYTRKLRSQSLLWAAAMALLNLIMIPLLALVLIRLASKINTQIIKRVNKGGKDVSKKDKEQRATTLVGVFQTAWAAVVIVVAGIYILKQFRIDITPIIASAGVVGLAFAFGAQTLIRDYFYGFFILLENQYMVGDVIQIGATTGKVEKITLRLTILRSLDGTVHFIPNGTINQVSNRCKKFARAVIDVGVHYNTDLNKALAVLKEVGEDLKKDPEVGSCIMDEFEVLGVDALADSSINLKMWIKTYPGDQFKVSRAARKKIKEAFDRVGIEIPFPQRVVTHVHEEKKG